MYAVGLEGGGSHTYVVVVDLARGAVAGRKTVERSSNRYAVGLQPALAVMHEAIQGALADLGVAMADVKQVGVTASGFNTADPEIDAFFRERGYPRFTSTHDTDGPAVAYQLEHRRPCCVLIAGTGSAAKVFVDGRSRLLAAYGHELNECGAAYSSVRRFVNRVLDEFDWDDQTHRPEWLHFCAAMGISEDPRHKDLLDLFYGGQKQKIAGYARHMTEHAREHPVYAEVITEELRCVANLIRQAYAAFRQLGGSGTLPIIKVGGYWKNAEVEPMRSAFQRMTVGLDVQLLRCHADAPAVGAALEGLPGGLKLGLFSE